MPDLCAPQTLLKDAGAKGIPSDFVSQALESGDKDLLAEALDANHDDLENNTRLVKEHRGLAEQAWKKSNATYHDHGLLLELKGNLKLAYKEALHKIEIENLKGDQAAEMEKAYDNRKKAWEEVIAAKIAALQQAVFTDEPEA